MKLNKLIALAMCGTLMLTGCTASANDDEGLTGEERELNAVRQWFAEEIFDEDEFSDLTDYQYYARAIGLEKDGLLAPEMWEIYYSDSININKEIDGAAVYLIRLNPDKLLEIWAENNNTTAEEICSELGTSRDELYYNFGYTANSIDYFKNHKENKVSYPETEERIFGADNGENRQAVFATHFLKVNIAGRYGVTYSSTDEVLDIKQRDLLKSITKPKTYNCSDFDITERTPAFYVNNVGVKRLTVLDIPNGWTIKTVQQYPDYYNAYFAMSQTCNQKESEYLAYDYMKSQYEESGNTQMVKKFTECPMRESEEMYSKYFSSSLRDTAMHELGVGTTRDMNSVITGIFFPSLRCTAYTWEERINIWNGKTASRQFPVVDDSIHFNAFDDVQSLQIPVYFFAGKYDYTCCYELQYKFYEHIDAPKKAFFTFDDSAHSPMFEEPEEATNLFERILDAE